MPRRNGSYFGLTVNPTPSVASGIWRVREAEEFLRVNKWPATPGVPGSPVGTAGDEQVSLTWSAPSLGSPPTDYQVQYSSDAGATWTTFADGTSAATSAVVTGLTNGTGYIFRVRAVNALGEGPYGAASGVVTPTALNVALLLHFDGSGADSSPLGLEFASPPGSFSTSEKRFGTASYSVDSQAGFTSTTQGIPDLSNGDWTIEAWVYRLSANAPLAAILYLSNSLDGTLFSPGLNWYINANGTIDYNNASDAGASGGNVAVEEWVHIALVSHQGTVTIYQNGLAVGTTTNGPSQGPYFAHIGSVPGYGTTFSADILIDELRIVTGTAVYTANFTPPTAPF